MPSNVTMKAAEDYKNGQLLLIDKPLEWTSFQVVNKLRWLIRKQFDIKKIKVGHAGTLDPLATGLLVICTGKFTKRIPALQGQIKEYTGTITLGATTPSYDLETAIDQHYPTAHITPELLHSTSAQFLGTYAQYPPIFSALKKEGKRLYEYARAGEEITIAPRQVTIEIFEITAITMPQIHFRVICSKGTYIRSLAYDFGKALQSGAHLCALRRTKIGEYNVIKALTPFTFEQQLTSKDGEY